MKQFSIFLSYSHKDKKYREQLVPFLNAWLQSQKGTVWHDGAIVPGTEWKPEIQRQLQSADIILLLISVDFVNSPFIRRHELGQALKRHNEGTARVIPVLVRTVPFFERFPFGTLQSLPSNAKPIERWRPKAAGCANVIEGIDRVLNELVALRSRPRRVSGVRRQGARTR